MCLCYGICKPSCAILTTNVEQLTVKYTLSEHPAKLKLPALSSACSWTITSSSLPCKSVDLHRDPSSLSEPQPYPGLHHLLMNHTKPVHKCFSVVIALWLNHKNNVSLCQCAQRPEESVIHQVNAVYSYSAFIVLVDHSKCFYTTGFGFSHLHTHSYTSSNANRRIKQVT